MSSSQSAPDTNREQPRMVAFLSSAGGVGRSSAVANLAWILASANQRVLVIDWCTEPPTVGEYLEPFHVDRPLLTDVLDSDVAAAYSSVVAGAEQPVRLDVYALPEATGRLDVVPNGGARDLDPHALPELRAALRRCPYDYVLVDSPTGTPASLLTAVGQFCDVAVVCFLPRPRAITDAARLSAQLLREATDPITVVPVATMFDTRFGSRALTVRSSIRAVFADLIASRPGRATVSPIVELSYQPYQAFEPTLAVLVEDPDDSTEITAAYEALCATVTSGAVPHVPKIPPVLAARYRAAFGLEHTSDPYRVLVAYAAPDRRWADWVSDQLERAGARTRSFAAGREWLDTDEPLGMVVITSPHLDESIGDIVDAADRARARGTPLTVMWLRYTEYNAEDTRIPPPVLVMGDTEQRTAARLMTYFGLIGPPSGERTGLARFPLVSEGHTKLPPRHEHVVGREEELEAIRDLLVAAPGGDGRVTIAGPAGIGKSALALEYAYRFAFDYDLVWWLPAHDSEELLAGLGALDDELRRLGWSDTSGAPVPAALSDPRRPLRWLLVYDGVADPSALTGLLPPAVRYGHVLVTAGAAGPAVPVIELAALRERDSVLLLDRRVPALSAGEAREVAAAVDHLPLALDLAVAWLSEAIKAQRAQGSPSHTAAVSASRELLALVELDQAGRDSPVARVLAVVTSTLRQTVLGRGTLLLAELCAFLSPRADLRLVRSRPMLARLIQDGDEDTAALATNAVEIDRMLWTGARYGLFHVDWGRGRSLRMHRVVQAGLREAMTPEHGSRRREAVLAVLAAYAPNELEEDRPDRAERFDELWKHVVPSGALRSTDVPVRRWLVNQFRHLYVTGDAASWRISVPTAQALYADWSAKFGQDELACGLLIQLANLLRALGHYRAALEIGDDALAALRRTLPLTHPQVLVSARGRGGDLRGLGLFLDALAEDQATWDGFRESLGEDHPHTARAANNLALTYYLSGDPRAALSLEQDNHDRRRRLLGPDDPNTWWSLCNVGAYLRELGRYDEALHALRTAIEHIRRLRPEKHPDELRIQWNLATTERTMGRAVAGRDRVARTVRDYRETLGDHHPDTVACTVSYAAACRVTGDARLAIDLVEECLASYRGEIGLPDGHPFVALCRMHLGLGLCADDRPGIGREESAAAEASLRSTLGDSHPWTLAAVINHARVLAADDASAAGELTADVHDYCLEFLGYDHPYTKIAAHNRHGRPGAGWKDIDIDIPQT